MTYAIARGGCLSPLPVRPMTLRPKQTASPPAPLMFGPFVLQPARPSDAASPPVTGQRSPRATTAADMFNNTTRNDSMSWGADAAPGSGQASVIEEMIADFSSRQMRLAEVTSILLIGMYVPLFLVAAVANSVVIVVVIKYHYMRR